VEATRRVEAPSKLQCEGLAVDETILARRADGSFVEQRGIGISSLDPSDLRRHQERPVFEVLGTVPSPYLELPMMGNHCLQVLTTFVGRRWLADGCMRQSAEELMLGSLEHAGRFKQECLPTTRDVESRRVVPGEEASLQLADPVPTFDLQQVRLRREVALHLEFIEMLVIERAELGRGAAQVPNQRRLSADRLRPVDEGRGSAERKSGFSLSLDFDKRVARQQKVREQKATVRYRDLAIVGAVGNVRGSAYDRAAARDVFRPGHYH